MTTTRPTAQDSNQPEARYGNAADEDRRLRTFALFSQASTSDSSADREALLAAVIELHLSFAHRLASRYRHRGVPIDDLRQVAALGLTKATHRFNINSGHDFLSYAAPTIRGELRRYFRDHGWMVRPPRRVQELQSQINETRAELTFRLGRSPQPSDIAEQLGESHEAVIEALASDGCFSPASLDGPINGHEHSTLGESLPQTDTRFAAAEAHLILRPLIDKLPERDRHILHLRFYENLTQREIGQEIGVAQMQVSRLLTRILSQLRHDIGEVATS